MFWKFAQQQREKAWFASSPRSRLQYLGPYPGIPSLDDQSTVQSSLDQSAGPVDAFCLLVLDPDQVLAIACPFSKNYYVLVDFKHRPNLAGYCSTQVDYLNLKGNARELFTSVQSVNGEKLWNSKKINP